MQRRYDYERLIEHVMRRTAIRDAELAERVTRATLTVLGQRLADFEADEIAEQLPHKLVGALRAESFDDCFDASELYARVAGLVPELSSDDAPEVVQGVLRTLGDVLVDPARRRLDMLPDEISDLFAGRVTAPPRVQRVTVPRDTFAEGTPPR